MQALNEWMLSASAEEQEALAASAGTSRAYLYQLSSAQRNVSATLARKLEIGAAALRRKNKALPELRRESLCEACGACEFAKQARK